MTLKYRTSESHPLKIDILSVNPQGGRIGMTFCPGKYQPSAVTGAWDRDLDLDIKAIVDSGATTLISLLEPHELESLQVTELPAKASSVCINQYTLPIPDGGVPSTKFIDLWESIGKGVRDSLRNGELVVIHCKGGLGRTGMLAACICVELGVAPKLAIEHVRMIRPGAIETINQERFVFDQKPVTDYAQHDEAGNYVKMVLKENFLTSHQLPNIDYPVPLPELVGKKENFLHSMADLLIWLQAYSEYDPHGWREIEPAITRLSEILSSDVDPDKPYIDTEKCYLAFATIDLSKEIITLQRQGRLIAAIQHTEEGGLKVAVYSGLDARSVELLTALGHKPNDDGMVCMRENNWEYALDAAAGNGQFYASLRGDSYLSYWEYGLGVTSTGALLLSWFYQRQRKPVDWRVLIHQFMKQDS